MLSGLLQVLCRFITEVKLPDQIFPHLSPLQRLSFRLECNQFFLSFSLSTEYKLHSISGTFFAGLCPSSWAKLLGSGCGIWIDDICLSCALNPLQKMALGNLMHFGAEITSSKDKYCLQQAYKTRLFFPSIDSPWKFYINSGESLRPSTKYVQASSALLAGITPPECLPLSVDSKASPINTCIIKFQSSCSRMRCDFWRSVQTKISHKLKLFPT